MSNSDKNYTITETNVYRFSAASVEEAEIVYQDFLENGWPSESPSSQALKLLDTNNELEPAD